MRTKFLAKSVGVACLAACGLSACGPRLIGALTDSGSAITTTGGTGTGGSGAAVSSGVDLEVPITMLDGIGLGSNGAGVRASSWTNFNPDDYDGTVTYQFEVLANNTTAATKQVYLRNKSGVTLYATATIPASTTMSRVRVPFTIPTTGPMIFAVGLEATGANYDFSVWDARIIVQQRGATKTRIYIPLVVAEDTGAGGVYHQSGFPDLDAVGATNSAAYTQTMTSGVADFPIWVKDSSKYSQLSGATPWTFEAMLYGDGAGAIADVALYDITAGAPVASITNSVSNSREHLNAALADAALPDGHQFEVRVRKNGGGTSACFHKAGIWVKLQNLTKGEVYYKLSRSLTGQNTTFNIFSNRVMLDVSPGGTPFTSPKVYLEATHRFTAGAGTSNYFLRDDGATVDGTANTGSAVVGSSQVMSATKSVSRSANLAPALSSIGPSNYYLRAVRSGGDLISIYGSFLVVGFGQ